jgi:hypothetical protein
VLGTRALQAANSYFDASVLFRRALFKTLEIWDIARCHRLSEEPVDLVPFNRCTRRPRLSIARRSDKLALHGVIVSPVLEIGLQALADLQPTIIADHDVSLVEWPMNIRAEKQSIRHVVLASFLVRTDVSGIEDRKGAFSGHSASMLIDRRLP